MTNDPCPCTRKLQNNVIIGECEIASPSQQDREKVYTRKLQNNVIIGECVIGGPSQQDREKVRMNGWCVMESRLQLIRIRTRNR